jgi:hypothetical protein
MLVAFEIGDNKEELIVEQRGFQVRTDAEAMQHGRMQAMNMQQVAGNVAAIRCESRPWG